MSVPPLERTITQVDMVAYAGATWDWHGIHHDHAFLAAKGLEKPVVDGQAIGALMAEQILDHLGPSAFIATLSIRYRAMMFAGETIRIEATTDDERTFTQRALVGDRVVAEGTTEVRVG